MDVCKLPRLQFLELDINQISQVPPEIEKLPKDCYICLERNPLSKEGYIQALKFQKDPLNPRERAAILDLEQHAKYPLHVLNHIKEPQIPEDFHGFVVRKGSVVALYSRILCKPSDLPPSIGDLPNLETLFLRSTKITSLPDSIGNLTHLIVLNLAWCRLTQLPHTIKNLQWLMYVNLSEDHLTEFPLELGFLPKLRDIQITLDPPYKDYTVELIEKFRHVGRSEQLQAFQAELRRVYAIKYHKGE